MSWFNEFGRRIKSLTQNERERYVDDDRIADPEIETQMGAFGKLMISVLVFPLQILFLPMRFLGLFHQSGVSNDAYEGHDQSSGSQLAYRSKSIFRFLLRLPYLIVTAPIRFFQGVGKSNAREILFIIPAVLMVGFLIYVGMRVVARPETINNRYAKEVKLAMEAKDFTKAKTYFKRILQTEELSLPQKMQWMIVLSETGENEKAEAILEELAPEDSIGFAPAHKIKALRLASRLRSSDDPGKLASLERHLTISGDESPLIQQAWAIYYRLIDKPDKAIKALAKAAEVNPTFFTAIARYQGELNRTFEQQETLKTAEKHFRELLEKEPLNSRLRFLLANSLSQQQQFDDAEQILVDGMQKQPDEIMRSSTASFFTMRHDIEKVGNNDIGKRIRYLFRAVGAQPQHLPVYERLIQMAIEPSTGEENAARIRDELNHLIASDEPNPLAHFALSNILWQDGQREKAKIHLELAHKIEPRFVIVLNNLAWMLANQEEPDFERALELSNRAVEAAPQDGRYRETRGSIKFQMGDFQNAIADLELAVSDVQDKIAVRKKLAQAYSEIGMSEQAAIHQKIVQQSMQ